MKPSADNKFKLLIWLLPASVMAAIFMFSAQTGAESGELSGSLTRWAVNAFSRLFPAADPDAFASAAGTVIRKIAHVTEFMLLYLSYLAAFKLTCNARLPILKRAPISLLLTFLYACSDELHQLFVPGRAGSITDVLIDISVPAAATAAIVMIKTKKQGKSNDK